MRPFVQKQFKKIIAGLDDRSKNVIRHIRLSLLFRLASVAMNFMLVPLAIRYLGAADYGLWLTISSVLTWFFLFDIGLGNGLRNKFAEEKVLGEESEIKAFVSTSYLTVTAIGLMLILLICLINLLVDWALIFNVSAEKGRELTLLMPVLFGFFGAQLVSKLVTSIYLGDQNHSILDKVQFATQTVTLLGVSIILKLENTSLLLFGVLYMATPVLVLIVLNYFAFCGRYARYRPSLAFFRLRYLREISGLGLRFFVIQIAAIVLFASDNMIISQLFGPAEVVPYSIAFKYFSIITMAYGIVTTPLWSSFTDAWYRGDKVWIANAVSKVRIIWYVVPCLVLFMVVIAESAYAFWLRELILVPASITIACGLYVIVNTFGAIYVQFLNGSGHIKLQFYVSVVVIFVNIPLSILLAETLGLGVPGVVVATTICIAIPTGIWVTQYQKIMYGNAKGIWLN